MQLFLPSRAAFFGFLGSLLFFTGFSQQKPSYTKPFGKARLLADLRLYKQIHEQANSGLYKYRTKKQIDSLFMLAQSQITDKTSIVDFYKIIKILNDYQGSAHNGVILPDRVIGEVNNKALFFPLSLKVIDGQIVMAEAGPDIPWGSIIISINKKPAKTILNDLAKYTPTDGYNLTGKALSINDNFSIHFFWEYGTSDEFVVEYAEAVSKNFGMKTIKGIDHKTYFNHPYRNKTPPTYNFKILNPSTAMLLLNTFDVGDENSGNFNTYKALLDTAFSFIKANTTLQNLIIDLRDNNGGSKEGMIRAFQYLADTSFRESREQQISFQKIPFKKHLVWLEADGDSARNAAITNDQQKFFDSHFVKTEKGYLLKEEFMPLIKPEKNTFKGRIFVLTNQNVSGVGSQFGSLLRGHTKAVFIGDETKGGYYGHNGVQPFLYVLPNTKMKIWFNVVQVSHWVPEKASQPIGHGIMPDHRVTQSYDDFLKQRDAELWMALKLILEY